MDELCTIIDALDYYQTNKVLIYGIICGNAWYIVMLVVLVVLVLGCAQNDYYDFLSFGDNSILRQ